MKYLEITHIENRHFTAIFISIIQGCSLYIRRAMPFRMGVTHNSRLVGYTMHVKERGKKEQNKMRHQWLIGNYRSCDFIRIDSEYDMCMQ